MTFSITLVIKERSRARLWSFPVISVIPKKNKDVSLVLYLLNFTQGRKVCLTGHFVPAFWPGHRKHHNAIWEPQ